MSQARKKYHFTRRECRILEEIVPHLIPFVAGLCLLLLIGSCGGSPSVSSDTGTACGLELSYVGPTEPGTFGGLQEDSAQCQATSWREILEESEWDKSIFVSSQCNQQVNADGSKDKPYCDIASALTELSKQSFDENDDSVILYVDPGTYTMAETVTVKSVRAVISGLCSDSVTLQAAQSDAALLTMTSDNGKMKVEGVTIEGDASSLLSVTQGELQLANVRVEIGGDNDCFTVDSSSATLVGQYVEMDGNSTTTVAFTEEASDDNSDATTSLTLVTPAVPTCVHVSNGGHLDMRDFTIHDFDGVAILAEDSGSTATLTNGTIQNIQPDFFFTTGENSGYGIAIQAEATATLDALSVTEAHSAGVIVGGEGSTITVSSSHVSLTAQGIISGAGVGLIVRDGATGTITDSAIQGNVGPGLYVSNDSTVTADGLDIDQNNLNVVVADANLVLTNSMMSASESFFGASVGILVESFTEGDDVSVTLQNNIVNENTGAGLYLIENAGGGMSINIEDNFFEDNGTLFGAWGHAAFLNLPTGITVTNNCFDAEGSLAMVIDASNALLSQNIYQGVYDSFVIQHQHCDSYPTPTTPYQNPVDVTSETIPTSHAHCLCGARSDTAAFCLPVEMAPTLSHDFGLGEVTVME